MKVIPFSLAIILGLFINIVAKAQTISTNPLDLIITGTEVQFFKSELNNKDYKLYINLPENYKENPDKTYPVFYKLDGQWSFSSVVNSYHGHRYDGMVPELIIVGISYAGENADYGALRGNDFTPTVQEFVSNSGGAELFKQVLKEEIIPLIDKNYRSSKTERALAGTSLGGLFTHYVLFSEPDLFNAYLITNPSFWWDNDYSFKQEVNYSKQYNKIDARVMYVSGEIDAVDDVKRMVNQIEGHKYEDLSIKKEIVKNVGHSGTKSVSHALGLAYLYKRPTIKLPDNDLKKYAGTYKISWGDVLEVVVDKNKLEIVDFRGNPNLKIKALNDNQFTLSGSYHDFEFTYNDKGKVTGFNAELFKNDFITATKIK